LKIKSKKHIYVKILILSSLFIFSFTFTSLAQGVDCLVPCGDIISGGPPKDGIPAIDEPIFIRAEDFESAFSQSYLDNLYVIGVVIDGEARAYPRDILNWHEIVNDKFNGKAVGVTFCPLTGTGILYNTTKIGSSTLGTTGRLYENNLVFYDRNSDTSWSQMLGLAIKGAQIGENLPKLAVVETTYTAWKQLHPDTKVLSRSSTEGRNSRDYDVNPYPGYRSRLEIWFRTSFDHTQPPYNLYHEKALTIVLQIGGKTRLYPFNELEKTPVLNDEMQNESIFIVYDSANQLALAYNATSPDPTLNGTTLDFIETPTTLPTSKTFGFPVYQDQTGTIWNFKGEAISGPQDGFSLNQLPSYNAFWFAATAFFPDSEIFIENSIVTYLSTSNPINTSNNPSAFIDSNVPGFTLLGLFPIFIGMLVLYRFMRGKTKGRM
jgi:hypothetical protein